MNISYTGPLSRAWERMKSMLFRPFHIETWFVLGFSAFLASLFSHSSSISKLSNWKEHGHRGVDVATGQALEHARDVLLRLLEKPLVLLAIMVVLVMAMVLGLVLAWVSARAEFIFLDNVARRRASFTEPWHRLGRLGRSLFLWRAVYSFAFIVPLAFIVVPFFGPISDLVRTGHFELPSIAGMVLGVCTGVLMLMVLAWFYWLMDTFVVPLMYRHDENATQAWGRFWPLLTGHPGSFLAFTVFAIVVSIAAAIALAIIGFGTCCIGIVLMIIPYIGSVVLLPVSVTARGLGPEFLAQFGPEYETFPARTEDDDDAAMPPPPQQPPPQPPVL